jgi:ATP:ADP antiporter, AAA family
VTSSNTKPVGANLPPEDNALRRLVQRVFNLEPGEAEPVLCGIGLFFLVFAGYFMLRPVRETMGITGGVNQLQWLFTATFVVTLIAWPLFGWLASRAARRRVLPYAYGFFALNLLAFAVLFAVVPDDVWAARAFFVWISVFNLIAVSIAWSVCADVFVLANAKRLFALIATGASAGGLIGPLLAVLLVERVGAAGLLFISATMLIGAIGLALRLQSWRDRHPLSEGERDAAARARPLGGSPFAGAGIVMRSLFLLGIALFVLLLAWATTFLYFEQARLVALTFPDKVRQTQVFGTIDTIVQALAILSQLFITGQVAKRIGLVALLTGVPVIVAAGFVALALSPTFAVLAVVMIVRRVGEYAFVRPGREMLFTMVSAQARYKAKNFLDCVVYRGGDALSGWVKALVDSLAQHPALAAILGAIVALVWGATGFWLSRARPEARLG